MEGILTNHTADLVDVPARSVHDNEGVCCHCCNKFTDIAIQEQGGCSGGAWACGSGGGRGGAHWHWYNIDLLNVNTSLQMCQCDDGDMHISYDNDCKHSAAVHPGL